MPSKTTLLTALILVAAAFVPPRLVASTIDTMRLDGDSIAAKAAQLNTRSADVDAALVDRAGVEAEFGAALAAVPDYPELTEIIDQIDGAVRRHSMIWTSGSPSTASSANTTDSGGLVSSDSGIKAWTMSMTVTGLPEQLPALLDELRTLPRLVVVDDVNIQRFGDAQISSSMTVKFFALNDETQEAGDDELQ